MKILGFDSKKNKFFWEGLGFFLMFFTMLVFSILFHFFELSELKQAFKVLAVLLSLVFVFGIVFSLSRLFHLKEMRKRRIASMFEKNYLRDQKNINPRLLRWRQIKKQLQSKDPKSWRVAIIDADAMLEELITSLGYQGNTFGEKLKSIQENSPWLNDVWYVHKLRNNLAHKGSLYPLTEREVYRAFKIYENIFHNTYYI